MEEYKNEIVKKMVPKEKQKRRWEMQNMKKKN